MSGVFGYEDFCGNRAALECSYSSCDGCPVKDAAMPKITALQAENAKLRELVRDMWFWHYEGYIDNVPQEEQTEHIDGVMRRMRKLGCEVYE